MCDGEGLAAGSGGSVGIAIGRRSGGRGGDRFCGLLATLLAAPAVLLYVGEPLVVLVRKVGSPALATFVCAPVLFAIGERVLARVGIASLRRSAIDRIAAVVVSAKSARRNRRGLSLIGLRFGLRSRLRGGVERVVFGSAVESGPWFLGDDPTIVVLQLVVLRVGFGGQKGNAADARVLRRFHDHEVLTKFVARGALVLLEDSKGRLADVDLAIVKELGYLEDAVVVRRDADAGFGGERIGVENALTKGHQSFLGTLGETVEGQNERQGACLGQMFRKHAARRFNFATKGVIKNASLDAFV